VGRDDSAGRKKYQAPTVTRVALTSLPPGARGELAHLVAASASEAQRGARSNGGFRIVLDLGGRFRQVSKEFSTAVGYVEEELLGRRIDDVTASRMMHIPQHLGAVVHFGQFHCLWMFVHRDGHGVLVRSDWELLPDLAIEVFCELLAS
jgi:hypothetical protein